jgi:hypothetical protein
MNYFPPTGIEIITPYLLMAVSALLLAVGGTPVMRQVGLRLGVIDTPNARKVHTNPSLAIGAISTKWWASLSALR